MNSISCITLVYAIADKIITDCFEIGKDYHPGGNDIDKITSIFTPPACQIECQKLPACQYWTLNSISNVCIRKYSKPLTPANITYATSGPKYCEINEIGKVILKEG